MQIFLLKALPNIIGVAFGVFFLIISYKKFKNAAYEDKLKPIKFLYIILIVLEVVKIFYHISITGFFPPARYPIVFCSIIMFAYPLICHTKKGSFINSLSYAFSTLPSIIIGIFYLFLWPRTNIYSTYNLIMNLHSRFYHFTIMAGALYLIVVKLYDFKFKDFFSIGLFIGLYFNFCTVLSILIGGDIAYFGPKNSPIKTFYDAVGYATGNFILLIAAFLISFLFYYFINLFRKKKLKNSELY